MYHSKVKLILKHKGKRPKAIVSPISGTTRDIIESALNIDGFPVVLSDTAFVIKRIFRLIFNNI